MPFPTVADIGIFDSGSTAAASHSANYPVIVNAEQLLLYLVGCDGSGDTPSISGVPGITELYSDTHISHGSALYWRSAVGDEDGGNFTVDVTSDEEIAAYCLAINNWDGITPPEISAVATGSDAAPNPASLTPSWGAEDNLYLVFNTQNNDGTTGWPTGYDDNQHSDASLNNGIGLATQEIAGSPEDPDAFTISGSQAWAAWTIAVRPAAGGPGPTPIIVVPNAQRIIRKRGQRV